MLCTEGCFESSRGRRAGCLRICEQKTVLHSKNPYGANGGGDPSMQDPTTLVSGRSVVAQQRQQRHQPARQPTLLSHSRAHVTLDSKQCMAESGFVASGRYGLCTSVL